MIRLKQSKFDKIYLVKLKHIHKLMFTYKQESYFCLVVKDVFTCSLGLEFALWIPEVTFKKIYRIYLKWHCFVKLIAWLTPLTSVYIFK